MAFSRNIVIAQHQGRSTCIDVFVPETKKQVPVAIFFHGFKGFKDWGFFPYMHQSFISEGLALVTVNFSHNGVTREHPMDFVDLEAFSLNTISLELNEMEEVVEWVIAHADEFGWDPGAITLIGHSRGAAECIVYAAGDDRINNIVCWAPISDFGLAFGSVDKNKWKQEGKTLIKNARTGQEMPIAWSFWSDLQDHKEEFDILRCAGLIEMPMMIVHGTADESVPLLHSEKIYEQCLHAVMIPIEGANHTFNAAHPFDAQAKFPVQLQEVLINTIEFIVD